MKRLILHIGPHKTGTTSIQGTLRFHRDYLESHGICYVPLGLGPTEQRIHGQHNLAWGMISDRRYNPDGAHWPDILTYLETTNFDAYIISSEAFSAMKYSHTHELAGLLAHVDLEIVFFVRRHVDVLNSALMQNLVKWFPWTVKDYARRWFTRANPYAGFRPRLEPWIETFGRKHVHVQIFEDSKSDLTAGLLQLAGFRPDPVLMTSRHLNRARSLPHAKLNMAISRALQDRIKPRFYNFELAPRLSRMVRELPAVPAKGNFIPDEVLDALASSIEADLAWLGSIGIDLPEDYHDYRRRNFAELEPYPAEIGALGAGMLIDARLEELRHKLRLRSGDQNGAQQIREKIAVLEATLVNLHAGEAVSQAG